MLPSAAGRTADAGLAVRPPAERAEDLPRHQTAVHGPQLAPAPPVDLRASIVMLTQALDALAIVAPNVTAAFKAGKDL
jgi:hypothetical protein